MSDTKPWEGEKAPTQATPEEIAAAEAAATAKAEKVAADAEMAQAAADAAKAEAEAKAKADAEAKKVNTPAGKATGAGEDAPTKPVKIKSKEHGDIVVGGPQASLALTNLVSRGVSMKDAKKQLGIK